MSSGLTSLPPRPSLIGMDLAGLQAVVESHGGKPFAARQVAEWLYARREADLGRMTNLPRSVRQRLAEGYCTLTSRVIASEDSGEGTTKLGIRLHDGLVIETVLMREHSREDAPGDWDRYTICISTQAGCAMGCRFCASGRLGLKRHLSAGEILEQFFHVAEVLRADARAAGREPAWITNVVVMGMGEPLHNFEGLMGALRILNAEWGFRFGARRVTVSTVGLPDRIRELAGQGYQFNLAISLHATTDEQRTRLIPSNAATGLAAIVEAAADYYRLSRREVTFEYTLVGGENDTADDARRLVDLLAGFPRCNVNLIPMNPVEGSGLQEPRTEDVEEFTRILRAGGVNAHVRRKRGRRVQAACGQLRLKLEQGTA